MRMWKQDKDFMMVIASICMSLLGAIASYSNDVLSGREFKWRILFLQAFVAIFSGAMIVLIARYYEWNAELAGALAGLGGWSGAGFIKIIEKLVLRRLGIENDYKR